MYLEHFWLSVAGIFVSGMLSMLGIIIWADMRARAKRPKVQIKYQYDRTNPINSWGVMYQQYEAKDDGWYEVKPGEWMR